MAKSKLISGCGWATLFLFLFFWTAVLIDYHREPLPIPRSLAAAAVLLAVPCFGLWLLGSIMHRFRVGTAKMRAAAMAEQWALANAAPKPAPAAPAMKPARVGEAVMMRCAVCARSPVSVYCKTHGAYLCAGCWGVHETLPGECKMIHALDVAEGKATLSG